MRRNIYSLSLHPCQLLPNGVLVEKRCTPVVHGLAILNAKYKYRTFEYANIGDYIGLIRKSGEVVDFQIKTGHPFFGDPRWLVRVIEIARVVDVRTIGGVAYAD